MKWCGEQPWCFFVPATLGETCFSSKMIKLGLQSYAHLLGSKLHPTQWKWDLLLEETRIELCFKSTQLLSNVLLIRWHCFLNNVSTCGAWNFHEAQLLPAPLLHNMQKTPHSKKKKNISLSENRLIPSETSGQSTSSVLYTGWYGSSSSPGIFRQESSSVLTADIRGQM